MPFLKIFICHGLYYNKTYISKMNSNHENSATFGLSYPFVDAIPRFVSGMQMRNPWP